MDLITRSYAKKLASGIKSITVNSTNDGLLFITNSGTSFDVKLPNFHSHINLTILDKFSYDSTNNLLLYDGKPIVSGSSGTTNYVDLTNKPSINGVELSGNKTLADLGITNYNDTQVKTDIADLKSDKQDKADNSLDTTDKTVVGAINEINDSLLDNVTFSADYKNIILNRKGGLNPYTIPIASIIHNAKITEFNDVDSTNIGDGRTLVYDSATQKHKYVDSTGTDELVKMDSTTDAKYLSELIDKSTVVNENGVLKVKKLDGQQVTITEINYLKGLTMNVMDLVNMFSNGGVKIINTPINTYADLLAYDKTGLIDGISYLVYVLADETHDNAKTTYLIDKTSSTPTFFGNADSQRNFTTDPIDLANEVTNKLGVSNIDVDALWSLLTINDTYKTLTTKDEVFGTHGAKALYDELVTSIGKKANATDLTSHTTDTNIHVTTSDKTKWNKVDNKVDKTDLTTHTTDTSIHITTAERTKWNNKIDKTSILTTISASPSDSNLLSEKAIKSELDKKFNNSDLDNLKQGTLVDGASLNKSILLWDVGHYYFNSNAEWVKYEHIPNTEYAPHVYVTSVKPVKYENTNNIGTWFRQIKVEDHLGKSFIRTIYTINVKNVVDLENGKLLSGDQCSDTGWQRICTTSVADLPSTPIISENADITTNSDCVYEVINGICYITLWGFVANTQGKHIICTSLPKSKTIMSGMCCYGEDGHTGSDIFISKNGTLYTEINTTGRPLYGTLSYPVAEN